MTDYTDLIAALRLPIHGAQQEWTCRKAALALEALAGEVATLNVMVTDWIEAFDKQKARAEAAEAERDRLKAEYDAYRETSCESIDRLKAALERLGSVEAFTSSQGICPELYERITYARKALGDAS